MDEISIQDKVHKFLEHKNISNPFIKECILEFVENHTSLFGEIISEDDLIDRLENNLDKITFSGRKEIKLGEYKGRINDNTDQNEILIYANETDLEISESDQKMWELYTNSDKQKLLQEREKKKKQIKSTLIHELTHAAYTIKGNYGIGEKHIFSENGKNLFGTDYYSHVGGNANYIEAIVNYISSRIEGKNVEQIETYQYETNAIYMLAEKMDEEPIIKSAWNSDELSLKKSYEEKIGESYETFNKYMGKLVSIRDKNFEASQYTVQSNNILGNMEQLLNGKELSAEKTTFQDIPVRRKKDFCDGKSGLEDVSNTVIRRSLLDKATNYIKEILKNKQKIQGTKEER